MYSNVLMPSPVPMERQGVPLVSSDYASVRRSAGSPFAHWNLGRREPLLDGMKVEATVPIILWLLGVPLVVVVVLMLAHVI